MKQAENVILSEEACSHFDQFAATYDLITESRQNYLLALDEIVIGVISSYEPCSHLDIGCGTGRLLLKLRAQRIKVNSTGIDISPNMIAICRSNDLEVHCCNLLLFDCSRKFDVISLTFNVFGYLVSQYGVAAVVDKLDSLLAPCGTVVFDYFNGWCMSGPRVIWSKLNAILWWPFSIGFFGGIRNVRYAVPGNSHLPVQFSVVSSRFLMRKLAAIRFACRIMPIRYGYTTLSNLLPRALRSQFVVIARRRN